jgi:hypothetical protein
LLQPCRTCWWWCWWGSGSPHHLVHPDGVFASPDLAGAQVGGSLSRHFNPLGVVLSLALAMPLSPMVVLLLTMELFSVRSPFQPSPSLPSLSSNSQICHQKGSTGFFVFFLRFLVALF